MKNLLIFLIASMILFSCKTAKKDEYQISGSVKGADSGLVYLFKFNTEKWEKIDSAQLSKGSFTFAGKVDMPEFYQLRIEGNTTPVSFFLENADITMTVDADSIQLSEVKGSATHDLYRTYISDKESIDNQMNATGQKWNAAKEAKDSLGMVNIEKQYDSIDGLYKKLIVDFAQKNPASAVAPYLVIRNAWQFELTDLDTILANMDTATMKSIYAQAIEKRAGILRSVQIGQQAPDFTMNNTKGEPVLLSSLKGKYLLVDFWASWCGPCRAENPNVVAAYNNFKGKGFDILGVSFDKDKEKWLKAIDDDKLTWTHVSDIAGWDNAAGKLYGVSSIPANVLLDPDQKIIGRNLRGEDLNNMLVELFGKPAEKKVKKGK